MSLQTNNHRWIYTHIYKKNTRIVYIKNKSILSHIKFLAETNTIQWVSVLGSHTIYTINDDIPQPESETTRRNCNSSVPTIPQIIIYAKAYLHSSLN